MNTQLPLAELIPFVNELADASGSVILRYFRQDFAIEQKADDSPVTIADRETEQVLRDKILHRFPEHGLYGEEYGQQQTQSRYCWVIDPIDGTKSFISGMPTFGTLIALLEDGKPILGVIDAPALKERWIGVQGLPTTYNGAVCHTGKKQQLAKASLYSTSIDMFQGADLECYQALVKKVQLRRFGGDCYAYGLLACGFIDIVIEADMQPYDYLAMAPIIAGAGGKISDWQGQALSLHSAGTVLAAATEELHNQALRVL